MEAVDGAAALTRFDGARIDLVITDVNMPNMDGIALVKKMRATPRISTTPVILLLTESLD